MTSVYGNNTWTPKPQNCWPETKWSSTVVCDSTDIGGVVPPTMANIPTKFFAMYTQDKASRHDWKAQLLEVDIEFALPVREEAFACADAAVIMDGLAALALLPGLEWLAFMALPAAGTSVVCDMLDHSPEEEAVTS